MGNTPLIKPLQLKGNTPLERFREYGYCTEGKESTYRGGSCGGIGECRCAAGWKAERELPTEIDEVIYAEIWAYIQSLPWIYRERIASQLSEELDGV